MFFDSVNDTNVEYSLRLRQNPAPTDTWFTDFVSRRFQPRGARVRPKYGRGRKRERERHEKCKLT